MSRQIITDDFGHVMVDGQLLPGLFESIDVSGTLRMDEQNVPGRSGSVRQPLGFECATVSLRLTLVTDDQYTCYDRLEMVARLFRAVDKKAKPYVRRLVNKHTAAWGISEVLFKDLRTSEGKSDLINADIVFEEYRPAVVKKERAVIPAGAADFSLPAENLAPASMPTPPIRDDDEVVL